VKAMLDSLHQNPANEHPILRRLDGNTVLSSNLQIEVNQVAFNLFTENNEVAITTERVKDLRLLAKGALQPLLRNKATLDVLEAVLEKLNLTVYVQNRFFKIIGPRANPFLRKLLYWFVA
jgi:hypothetical protein